MIDFGSGRWHPHRLPLTGRSPTMDRQMIATKRVAFLLFEGCDVLDVAGAVAVFDSACRRGATAAGPTRLYECLLLSLSGGLLRTEQSMIIETGKAWDFAVGEIDTIIVVGGSETLYDDAIADWLRRNHAQVRRTASVCLGTFLLAQAGLLDSMQATTHWDYCELLSAGYPTVEVVEDAIYIPGGHVWTSAGVTSGIDMALAMVEEDYGRELALAVARYQVVFLKRPGGQSQFSAPLRMQSVEGPLAPLLKWIADNPCADLRTENLAERANMSLRNFFRAFEDATGSTPAEWVERTRVDHAKRLLEQTSLAVDQVAFQSGFGTYERMRKTFARRLHVTPGEYRARFSRETPPEANLAASLLASRRSVDNPARN